MPTKDHLSKIDEEHALYLLRLYLTQVNSTSVVWVLPYVYELVIVLICKRGGLDKAEDRYCSTLFSEWIVLVKARNACSHNIYDSATVRDKLSAILLSNILYSIFTELGIEIELYMQLHYSIVFLLRKENIYE